MKTKIFFRHVKDSLRSLKRNGWMSVAAVSAVTVTLLLVGIFMALIFNLHHVSEQVENDVQVRVYIEKKTTTKQRDALKTQLEKLDNVKSDLPVTSAGIEHHCRRVWFAMENVLWRSEPIE